ncbi:MAG: MATE family efflux transporter [Kiritimatiellia bacterium]
MLNIVATYGRSLYALVLGLFTGRWVLMALGHEGYGLYGVVGGMTFFLSFFNSLSATAISRFYAYEVGKAANAESYEEGLLECRRWFNTALMIHSVVPLVCVVVGYPLGEWAVRNWLAIPSERVGECVQVFRFACISCLSAMVNVPFQAMYTAKQYIAELTIYGIAASTLQACFLYYIASHPSNWLVRYAAWTCFIVVVPQIIICLRALRVFPECRINLRLCWDRARVKSLLCYSGWHTFGALGGLFRGQGLAILVNKYFGANANAAMSIANTVNGQAGSLAAAMQGAFTPAISQACGAGDDAKMRSLAYRACKFGLILTLMFAIPLSVEITNVMTLWLKNPPTYAAGLCLCMIAMLVADKSTIGHMCAVNAKGRIALYQFVLGGCLILTLPVAWVLAGMGYGIYSVGAALFSMTALSAIGRVWFARKLAGMGMRFWLVKIVLPIGIVSAIASGACFIPRSMLPPTLLRLCITSAIAEITMLPLVWSIVLQKEEREYVACRIARIRKRFV